MFPINMPPFALSPFLLLFAIFIVALGGVLLWKIAWAILAGVRDMMKHSHEIELKQTLVDRGMSAEEIERIVRVTPDSRVT